MKVKRVLVTEKAAELIQQLRSSFGELIFHQSGGCCDGSAPMCLSKDELIIDKNDVCLGRIEGCPFYMSNDQFEYWKHTQLTIDAVDGRGSSFSLEIPFGFRFVTKSRMFTDLELNNLEEIHYGQTI